MWVFLSYHNLSLLEFCVLCSFSSLNGEKENEPHFFENLLTIEKVFQLFHYNNVIVVVLCWIRSIFFSLYHSTRILNLECELNAKTENNNRKCRKIETFFSKSTSISFIFSYNNVKLFISFSIVYFFWYKKWKREISSRIIFFKLEKVEIILIVGAFFWRKMRKLWWKLFLKKIVVERKSNSRKSLQFSIENLTKKLNKNEK